MSKDEISYTIENILLPTDGSKYSIKAAKYAAEIAKKHGSKVTLLHVLELNLPNADYPIEFDDLKSVWIAIEDENEIKKRGVKVMNDTKTIFDKADVSVHTEYYSFGKVHQIIVETAKKENVDLIIMGHQGLGGVKHLVLGSVAEEVCRSAPCPVLIIR